MENTQQNNCINKGRPVYFSYARNSSRKPEWNHISDCVDNILDQFKRQNIEYRVDVRDIGSGDKISDFEKEIGWNSEVVILVFSDKYFRSLHCMYEFVQIKKALAKHPEKHLICIRSGNVDIADTNYMIEVEHYWGDIRQEYETIEFHHLRNHSGTERAAFENNFYLDEIRELSSFFSNYTIYDADRLCDGGVLAETIYYFQKKKRSFLQVLMERRAKYAKMIAYGMAFSALLTILFGLYVFLDFVRWAFNDYEAYYPRCLENCYAQDDEAFTCITKLYFGDDYTTLYFRTINLTDDTLHRVEYDTVGARLKRELSIWNKNYPLLEVMSADGERLPEYYPGGKGAFVDYVMKFGAIGMWSFDFINDGRHRIHQMLILEPDFEEEYPECSGGVDNLYVNRVVVKQDDYVMLQFHIVNPSEKDAALFDIGKCLLIANGDSLKVSSVGGLRYPLPDIIYKKTARDFALYFPYIDVSNVESLDFVIDKKNKITGIKLNRNHYYKITNPDVLGYSLGGVNVTKVQVDSCETVVHFRQTNRFKKNPIFAIANSNSFIRADGKKYSFKGVSGIAKPPKMTMIPAGDALEYALIFEPIPPETRSIDFVNVEFSRKKLGDKEFRLLAYVLGSECANERGDTISTGVFGIMLE